MRQRPVSEFIGPVVHSIDVNATLADAHRLMRAKRIRHLPVLEDKRVVGLVSQRDLYFLETLPSVDPEKATVEEAMSREPYMVEQDTELGAVVLEMWKYKLGSAVVMRRDRLVGIFTSSNALHALAVLLEHPQVARNGRKVTSGSARPPDMARTML